MATNDSKQLPPRVKDIRGNVYGLLTVLEFAGLRRQSFWTCLCKCGSITTVRGNNLRHGAVKSCGCLRSNQGGGHETPEYDSWRNMKARCYSPRYHGYHLYGGRGITICERWRTSFVNFLADMGPKPFPEATIDRYPDQNGPYSPENCRWATRLEQGQNTRKVRLLTYNGETMCLRAWARRLGITHRTLTLRINRGLPPEKVFSTEHYFSPPPKKRARTVTT